MKKQKSCFNDMPITSIKENNDLIKHDPKQSFKDHEKVALALLECLIDNDTKSYIEILDSYLRVNRTHVAMNSKLSRSTVQQAFSKKGNPTLKTIAKIVHEASVSKK